MWRAGTGVWVFAWVFSITFFFELVREGRERMKGTSNQILLLLRWQACIIRLLIHSFFLSHVTVLDRLRMDLLHSLLDRTMGLFGWL